jgi:phosphonate transport system permease protein
MAHGTATRPLPPPIPRPHARPWTVALLVLAVGVVYGYGWKVTQIDLGQLVTKVHLVRPLVRDLVRPDVLTWVPRVQRITIPFSYVAEEAPGPAPAPRSGPQVTLAPRVAPPGRPLRISGEGFAPDRPGRIVWTDQSGASAPGPEFRTDREGRFVLTVPAPTMIGTHHQVTVEVWLGGRLLRPSATAALVGYRLLETVFLALMGTTLAVLVAVPLSFLGARNLMARSPVGTVVYFGVRTFMNIMRSIEPLIMATVFAVWVGIGPFAGVLALALHSVASLGKLYSEQIESIDPGPIEAITATGASPLQVVRYAVIPQIVPPFIAFTIYRWDINVRMSTVIGMVGGGGVGYLLMQYINLLQWQQAATAVWGITLIVAAMDYFSAAVRERVV